jgi:hypothetical protein
MLSIGNTDAFKRRFKGSRNPRNPRSFPPGSQHRVNINRGSRMSLIRQSPQPWARASPGPSTSRCLGSTSVCQRSGVPVLPLRPPPSSPTSSRRRCPLCSPGWRCGDSRRAGGEGLWTLTCRSFGGATRKLCLFNQSPWSRLNCGVAELLEVTSPRGDYHSRDCLSIFQRSPLKITPSFH